MGGQVAESVGQRPVKLRKNVHLPKKHDSEAQASLIVCTAAGMAPRRFGREAGARAHKRKAARGGGTQCTSASMARRGGALSAARPLGTAIRRLHPPPQTDPLGPAASGWL